MANQSGFPSTLQPVQPKREVRRDQILGGTMGFIDETIGETFTYITGDYPIVNEGPVRGPALENLNKSPEMVRGELTGFRKPRTEADVNPEIAVNSIQQEILAEHNQAKIEPTIEQRRTEVNSKIGIGNVLYKDTVRDDGTLRVDVQVDLDRKNSELDAEQLKVKRESQIALARGKTQAGFPMRQGELDMGKERVGGGHFTTAPG